MIFTVKSAAREIYDPIRANSIRTRKRLVAALRTHGVEEGDDFAYCTNAIYRGVFGRSARQMLGCHRLVATCNLRDHLVTTHLMAVEMAERLASARIAGDGAYGVQECHDICESAGMIVRSIIDRPVEETYRYEEDTARCNV